MLSVTAVHMFFCGSFGGTPCSPPSEDDASAAADFEPLISQELMDPGEGYPPTVEHMVRGFRFSSTLTPKPRYCRSSPRVKSDRRTTMAPSPRRRQFSSAPQPPRRVSRRVGRRTASHTRSEAAEAIGTSGATHRRALEDHQQYRELITTGGMPGKRSSHFGRRSGLSGRNRRRWCRRKTTLKSGGEKWRLSWESMKQRRDPRVPRTGPSGIGIPWPS